MANVCLESNEKWLGLKWKSDVSQLCPTKADRTGWCKTIYQQLAIYLIIKIACNSNWGNSRTSAFSVLSDRFSFKSTAFDITPRFGF